MSAYTEEKYILLRGEKDHLDQHTHYNTLARIYSTPSQVAQPNSTYKSGGYIWMLLDHFIVWYEDLSS